MSDHGQRRREPRIGDSLRKLAYLGAGTIFYTQENVARMLSENLKIPKELAHAIVTQLDRAKDDAIDVLSKQIADYLKSIDLADLARRVSNGLELKIDATVKVGFADRGRSVRPRITGAIRNASRPKRTKPGNTVRPK